ncbi:hypothetical protein M426DRAFT_73453 [Hypoxylon sp. CI-4A]|nr:hypothetical protein M426DRAFT_73453 [Hypoxylon sp. CI-4A]
MSTQTVYRLTSKNGVEGLTAFQEPIPEAGKHEIVIKIRSVSVNYRDVAIATSVYPPGSKDNVIPCSDAAGEVVAIGDSGEMASGWAVGDAVILPLSPSALYGLVRTGNEAYGGPIDGMLREYIAVPAHVAIKVSKDARSFAQWTALICTGATVWNALYGGVPLKTGDTILVQGTGGVSLTALILAKAAGVRTIVTSSSDEKLEFVKTKLGADHTINYKKNPDWGSEAQRITGGNGVDHVIDVGGAGTIEQSFKAVAFGGIISIIGFLAKVPQEKLVDVSDLALFKGVTVRGVLGGSKQQLEECVRFVLNRDVYLPIDKTFSYTRDDIVKAFKFVESGGHIGKVVVNLD